MDCGDKMILFIGKVVSSFFCEKVHISSYSFKLTGLIPNYSFSPQMFGVSQPSYIDENLTDLPELENEDSERLRSFVVSFEILKKNKCLSLFSVLRRA